jgi:hypothetical protein
LLFIYNYNDVYFNNMNKLSFIGVILACIGNIFMVTDYVFFGCIIFLFSNTILGYVNRKDINQIGLYIFFQAAALYGIFRHYHFF